jgi:hypothetical protein
VAIAPAAVRSPWWCRAVVATPRPPPARNQNFLGIKRIESLGLDFYDVDLRWGVPETGVDGETANPWEYCKKWIDRVEPFFVCILGQRYGSVPEAADIKDETETPALGGFLHHRDGGPLRRVGARESLPVLRDYSIGEDRHPRTSWTMVFPDCSVA